MTTTALQPDGFRRRLGRGGAGDGGPLSMLLALAILTISAWGVARGALRVLASCPNRVLQVT